MRRAPAAAAEGDAAAAEAEAPAEGGIVAQVAGAVEAGKSYGNLSYPVSFLKGGDSWDSYFCLSQIQ